MRIQADLEIRVHDGTSETLPAPGRTVLVWLHASVRAGHRQGKAWMLGGCAHDVEIGDRWAYLEPLLSAALRNSLAPAGMSGARARKEGDHA